MVVRGEKLPGRELGEVTLPLTAYDAEIDLDLILSYEWLAERGMDIYPREHGLKTEVGGGALLDSRRAGASCPRGG